jgi:hypothetical protein
MLVDIRRYTVVPGKLKAYLEVYEDYGLPVQRGHVGDPKTATGQYIQHQENQLVVSAPWSKL